MSLHRRLLIYLLLCAPLVWGAALLASADRARDEVNELFDTEIIRLSRQVQATLASMAPDTMTAAPPAAPASAASANGALGSEADLRDLSIAAWNAQGRVLLVDREGVELPRRPDASGFVDMTLGGDAWRVYYLQSPAGEWLVAAGQRMTERDELVWNLLGSQLLPWLLVLPVLLAAMAWAVRQALAPVRTLATELQGRGADDLRPVPTQDAPAELQPLLEAMNGLFVRIESTLARERRFTADAAHELRTPLAVLRAQWDVVRGTTAADARRQAEARLSVGLDRIDRLVTQMLALSRVEATERLSHSRAVNWPALVAQVMNDVLPLAERRGTDLACDWPAEGIPPFVLNGDADLLAVLLRNLLDNALRYAPASSTVTLRFGAAGLAVHNEGPTLSPEALSRLGERFHRLEGQVESGSGLGVSIAQRIATLHGLALRYRAGPGGQGVVAELGVLSSP
ncbi:MAG: sensor histidine kinase N-terminal domain-containing protein [Betaproteobacteria bacterium]|nr:sensor histidine kinase N-terminal domain-containing protein [Betaproteobacteria bacterium]